MTFPVEKKMPRAIAERIGLWYWTSHGFRGIISRIESICHLSRDDLYAWVDPEVELAEAWGLREYSLSIALGPQKPGSRQETTERRKEMETPMLNTLKAITVATSPKRHGGAISVLAIALCTLSSPAQTAKDVKGATPLVAIQNEPAAKLIVDQPIPEQLALGRVFIQYRTENLRILPVFGKGALEVSPRVGHLHYFVDGQTWPIVDSSGETVVLVGLAPGPHKVLLQLADAVHRPISGASQLIEFTVPAPKPQN